MPWRDSTVITQRHEFITELLSGECSMSELCRRYGISRRCGYKWEQRFKEHGLPGLKDRSRRPLSSAKNIPHEVTTQIVSYRQAHPSWGAAKIRKILVTQFKQVPSRRTIHRVLQDCNLVQTRRARKRLRRSVERTVIAAQYCNHVWTVDFKGWWRTKDGKKVYPLTIRDEYSKFVLVVAVLARPNLELVKERFIECFKRVGLPEYIRCDNGSPFSFSQGLCGLSRLSAWWIKLGITPNFIPPASPQYNGGHERMHRDMAADLEATPARNLLEQQVIADGWVEDFNRIRPHDSLNDKPPASVYKRSTLRYKTAEPALEYCPRFIKRFVNKQGWFKFDGRRIFISKAVGHENIALEFTANETVILWFAHLPLGAFNDKLTTFSEFNLITGLPSVNKRTA